MKQLFNGLGALLGLFIFCAIMYGLFRDGDKQTISIVCTILVVVIVIIMFSVNADTNRENQRKQKEKAAGELRNRKAEIENMSDKDFANFIKYNFKEFENLFGEQSNGFNGIIDIKKWTTRKYKIVSKYNNDECEELITVFRKSDNQEIFCGFR